MENTAPRCPVCANAIQNAERACARCATPHHADCWAYSGGCAIYGCVETPADAGPPAAAAHDLSIGVRLTQRAQDSVERLPTAVIAGAAILAPALMFVSPWACLAFFLVAVFASVRELRVDPAAGTIETALRLFGIPLSRREAPLASVRRFQVRQGDRELAVLAALEDGGVMAISVARVLNPKIALRFESVIRGLRAHTKIHVVRYAADDPASLPKRVEQLRQAVAASAARCRAPLAVTLLALVLTLVCTLRAGEMLMAAGLAIDLAATLVMLAGMQLALVTSLVPRLSAWRVTALETALQNQQSDGKSVALHLTASAVTVAYAGAVSVLLPPYWGWHLVVAGCAAAALSATWVGLAWAHAGATRGEVLEAGAAEPLADRLQKAYRQALIVVCAVIGGVSAQIPQGGSAADALVVDVSKSLQKFEAEGAEVGRAIVPALNGEEPDLPKLERKLAQLRALLAEARDRAAARRAPWGAPAQGLADAYARFFEAEEKQIDLLATFPAVLTDPSVSPQQRARRVRELLADPVDEPAVKAVISALEVLARRYAAGMQRPPAIRAKVLALELGKATNRLLAAMGPLESALTSAGKDPLTDEAWNKGLAQTRDRLDNVERSLGAIETPRDLLGAEEMSAAFAAIVRARKRFIDTVAPQVAPKLKDPDRDARLAALDAVWDKAFAQDVTPQDQRFDQLHAAFLKRFDVKF